MPKKITIGDFVTRARGKHGDRYDYSSVVYKSMNKKVIIVCQIHGEFLQTPDNHLRSNGCKKCAYEFHRYRTTRHTTQRFIEKARKIHKNKYDYSKVNYINDTTKVTVICPAHGDMHISPSSHLQGWGCNSCSKRPRKTTEEFVRRCKDVHGNTYDYSTTVYKDTKTNVKIICYKHGEFYQHPRVHLEGGSCPSCRPRGYSLKSINWLNTISKEQKAYIQHAENEGEYRLPHLGFFVDGYSKETNTVYEFYGDIFHGNPKLFNSEERCGPSDKTAGELLKQTVERERQIIDAGYRIITIWESEWNEKQKKTSQSRSVHRHSLRTESKFNTS